MNHTLGLGMIILAMAAHGMAAPVQVDDLTGVVVQTDAASLEIQAADTLRASLKRMYGIDIPRITGFDGTDPGATLIVLGRAALDAGLVTDAEIDRVRPGGYVLKCGDKRIAIAGPDVYATYFGMISFLESLGMRFYLPDINRAYVPEVESRVIRSCTVYDRPVFVYRAGWSLIMRQMSQVTGDPRKGLNPELFTKAAGSDLWIDHSAGYLVPKRLYYDNHPEYYAMLADGTRIPKSGFSDHRTPLCLSNPEVTKISTERALRWVEMKPDKDFFYITYGDTGTWCQCPDCLALDHAPGQYATRLFHWANPVARAIGEQFPDKVLVTFAYGGSDRLPPVARPAENLWMVVATGAGNLPFFDHALDQDRSRVQNIEDWVDAVPGRVLVCEYLGAYEPAMLDQMTGRLRYYAAIGLRGVRTTYGAPVNFRQLWQYVWTRMNWDPAQDAHALAGDFIQFYYGPAAEPVQRFFELIHKQYQATLSDGAPLVGGANGYPAGFYETDFVRECLACFNRALEAVADDHRLQRELQTEMRLFLNHVVNHMPSYDLSESSNAELLGYLGDMHDLARATDTEAQFFRDVQALAATLEARQAGYRELVEQWLGAEAVPQPTVLPDGLQFSPLMFLRTDYGPGMFPGGSVRSHPDFASPPKLCAGVYMKATGGRGQVTSSKMHLDFELEASWAGLPAVLDFEGQDAISHWIPDHGKDWVTSMRILVNGREIFSGASGFVRGNWSRQQFDVPADILRAGRNRLEIENRSTRGWFAGCWVLISDAKLLF